MYGKTTILVLVCFIALCFVVGCTSQTDTSDSDTHSASSSAPVSRTTRVSQVSTPVQNDFTLVESHIQDGDFGTRYIVGTIKNNRDKTYSYVQVTINCYDASGTQIGSTLSNVNGLEPYASWKFKAIILEEDTASYKVMKITGW